MKQKLLILVLSAILAGCATQTYSPNTIWVRPGDPSWSNVDRDIMERLRCTQGVLICERWISTYDCSCR